MLLRNIPMNNVKNNAHNIFRNFSMSYNRGANIGFMFSMCNTNMLGKI